ncbi:MAG: hypothetical protein M3381_07510 [Actinomycetota bacterium]|nr:hypothetical protein [Actinomycetota bacterium]
MVQTLAKSAPATYDPFVLPPLEPSPGGRLLASVGCRTARTGDSLGKHEVWIEADWSVSTPHELALERIAMAMGGYLSCVDLADREVPALRELVQLHARRVFPQFTRNEVGRWTLRVLAPGCQCRPTGFRSATEAAEHARDPAHLARLYGVPPRELQRRLRVIEDVHRTRFHVPPIAPEAERAVREHDGVSLLWAAGVHPESVAAVHELLWPGGPPMPVWFYLGAVTHRRDMAWVAQTLAAVPDEDVAVWLCWTETELDRTQPNARAAWLRAGVPRKAIATLADGAYSPIDVARLMARTRRSLCSAAATLAAWHRAGCHPSLDDIALIDGLGADPWFEPSVGAVDWLWDRVGRAWTGPTRTQLGLLLAVCGTRSAVLSVLAEGISDPRAAARMINGDQANLSDALAHGVGPVTCR